MITSLKDEEGRIIAYASWRFVSKAGFDHPDGPYVWIEDLWVNHMYEKTGRINRIIDEIMRAVPKAKFCYFKREKYQGRMKIFSREMWERRRRTHDPLILKEH